LGKKNPSRLFCERNLALDCKLRHYLALLSSSKAAQIEQVGLKHHRELSIVSVLSSASKLVV
jgi:hypothetical protein